MAGGTGGAAGLWGAAETVGGNKEDLKTQREQNRAFGIEEDAGSIETEAASLKAKQLQQLTASGRHQDVQSVSWAPTLGFNLQ